MIRAAIPSLVLICVSFLTGCGFSPVYGSGANSGPIQITQIEGRTGHFLRQELIRTVGQGIPGVASGSRLEITLNESIDRLAFSPDQAASRSDYRGAATYALRDANGALLASGGVSEAASFNFADAAYADVAAQTAAQERLAALLARTIRDQLIVETGKERPPAP
ncbi:MAG: hypothetical protein SGJ21_17470 [Alphaproteobacteria bacterium]|nr:hypothetical protein [Alphaproteobacteria bacterium]